MSSTSPHVKLAKLTIESYVLSGRTIDVPDDTPEELRNARAGTFVSLKIRGQLRGCIGTIEPMQNSLAEEIIANAISAATRDPRFLPVEERELDDLQYSVDVLTHPEEISGPEELDPRQYGVIVESGRKRGLLLPDLEGIDTVEEQVNIAQQKAFIHPNEPIKLYRFRVLRHK